MANNEQKIAPRGQVALGSGDPRGLQSFNWKFANGAKMQPTLRDAFGPITLGAQSVTFDGTVIIDEDGPDRDYFKLVMKGEPQQCRVKLPGGVTETINGVITEVGGALTVDEGVKLTFNGIGRKPKS